MEADWTVALGSDDPVLTIPWQSPGGCNFVNLRLSPHRVDEISEVYEKPVLRSALLALNAPGSLFVTAKCDAWTSSAEQGAALYDPDEMDADLEETAFGAGSYIDLLHLDSAFRSSFERQESWMRTAVSRLRATPAKAARVELVLRHAQLEEHSGFAVTWFVEGCGRTMQAARQRWADTLTIALPVLMNTVALCSGEDTAGKIQ